MSELMGRNIKRMNATPKPNLIPQEYRDILPPASVRAITTHLLHMAPEDREDALQEAVVAHLSDISPSLAAKRHGVREALHRDREVAQTKLEHP